MTDKYNAYGDESNFRNVATYAIIGVKERDTTTVINAIDLIKTNFGVEASDEIHCKEIFNPTAKKKTNFSAFSEKKVQNFILAVVKAVTPWTFASVGIYNNKYFKDLTPIDLESNEKLDFINGKDRFKAWQAIAFQAASPIIDRRFGADNTKLWVDYDHTVVDIFQTGQKRQQYRHYNFFSLEKKREIHPQPKPESKPQLLQLADILAYSAAHSSYSKYCYNKIFFRKVTKSFSPDIAKLYPNTKGPSFATAHYQIGN